MHSGMQADSAGEAITAIKLIADGIARLNAVDRETLTRAQKLEIAQLVEHKSRALAVVSHDIAHDLIIKDPIDPAGPAHHVLANALRITPREARRRAQMAEPLSETVTITGERLAPRQPGTAESWRRGNLDLEHVAVIQKFLKRLPTCVDDNQRDEAERFLSEQAAEFRPDELYKLADKLADTLNPDGLFDDRDRASRRGFTWGRQQPDGMSEGKLWATPELRAGLDAFFAKFANFGVANPDDEPPVVNGTPSQDAINADGRSQAQRRHDALALLVRSQLGNPQLGLHNGLPVTIIATVTVEQLEHAAGWATTAGGTRLPVTDLIKMASQAIHYLAVFDGAENRPMHFGRARRIASADQRLVLMATQRGCTFPGCTMPGYLTEVHHDHDWSHGGRTDIEDLSLGCGPHHKLATNNGWRTRKNRYGRTKWIPPSGSPHRGGVNNYHHPERLLDGGDDMSVDP
jgi:hypothetical protein